MALLAGCLDNRLGGNATESDGFAECRAGHVSRAVNAARALAGSKKSRDPIAENVNDVRFGVDSDAAVSADHARRGRHDEERPR